METNRPDVTQLLIEWREGDEDARARLMPLIYEEVRRLTERYLERNQSDQNLPAAPLIHEAYMALVDDKKTTLKDRAHFYGMAARIVRTILVDHARAHNKAARRRGGASQEPALDKTGDRLSDEKVELVALDSALQTFVQTYPRQSEVVELKFFGGLDIKEISEVLQVSEKTVLRDWNFAKLWLCRALSEKAG
jgi:RNA polymerase sigma factor (TIGR02999 family)